MNDVNKIFREEFNGLKPEDIYAEFEEIPLAAASLAQVHKGKPYIYFYLLISVLIYALLLYSHARTRIYK